MIYENVLVEVFMKVNGLVILICVLLLMGCTFDIGTETKSSQTDDPNNDERPVVPVWKLVWSDEFDYEGKPDPEKWGYDIGGHGWGNNELQYYTDRLENASVSNGYLTITARKEKMYQNPYTSARLVSKNKGDFKYGKIEIRAKVPKERGTWSALWMLPTDYVYGGWPTSGEIDIMEHVGYDPTKIHGTIHTGKYNHKNGTQIGQSITVPDATTEFHTYTIEWYPREILFFVDDHLYFMTKFNEIKDRGMNDYMAWPFNQRFHLLMNIAVGGDWGGQRGIDPNWEKAEMVIDYVRVYERDFAHNDIEPPSQPEFEQANITQSSIDLTWTPSTDNQYVDYYEIYLNDKKHGTSFSAQYLISELLPETSYDVKVYAVDFAENRSEPLKYHFTTLPMPDIPGKIEGENYIAFHGNEIRVISIENETNVVGRIFKNESVTYGFKVKETGEYQIRVRAASNGNPFSIALYSVDHSGRVIENFGRQDFQGGNIRTYQTYSWTGSIRLTEGNQYLKLFNRSQYSNHEIRIDWIEITKIN